MLYYLLMQLTPNLLTDTMPETIWYYTQTLGFSCTMSTTADQQIVQSLAQDPIWAMLERDGATIFFQNRASLTEEIAAFANIPVGGGFTLYFSTPDVHVLYDELKQKTEIVHELYKTFYGVEQFIIRDCIGNYLYFGQA